MPRNHSLIHKYASMLYRLGQTFFNKGLKDYGIGCGQQFFLLRIHENPGITVLDLAQTGYYDNGTATRAVQKLEAEGYVRSSADEFDRRIRRNYTTEKALPVIEETYRLKQAWSQVLLDGLSPEEGEQAEALLKRLSENAHHYLKKGGTGV